jgi:hypothetical protein
VTRLLLGAVVLLAVVAAADSLRPKRAQPVDPQAAAAVERTTTVVHESSAGYVAVGAFTRKQILRHGRAYLSASSIDAAFPGGEAGDPFDISHLATAPDGTLALGVYRFPAKEPAEAAIELWRSGRLVDAFSVPPGSFGGGLGWAAHGRLVATVLADGLTVVLFSRSGKRLGGVSATSW